MDYKIVTGEDGREYAKFTDEFALDDYCVKHKISPVYYCVDGYMNGILIFDLVIE